MLSRVAESIYWMGRYVECAENLARFVDVTLGMMLDLPEDSADQWEPLVRTTGDHDLFTERYGAATQENVVRFLSFDSEYSNSVISCLQRARENARSIRETISSEMWEQLNRFYFMVNDTAKDPGSIESLFDFFQEVRQASYQFKGITDGTIPRGESWHFARLGRLIERADKTSRILDVKYFVLLPHVEDVGTPTDELQWSSVLRSVSGLEMFRKRHHGITPERVVGFLILDRLFPRSIMYCVNASDSSLHAISGSPQGTFWNPAEKQLGKLRSDLAYAHVSDIVALGLHQFLDNFQTDLNSIGGAIGETFFSTPTENEVSPLANATRH